MRNVLSNTGQCGCQIGSQERVSLISQRFRVTAIHFHSLDPNETSVLN